MRHFLKKVDLYLRNVILYAWFSEKVDLDLKMWTFKRHFLKKVDLYLWNMDLKAWFSEKSGPRPQNVDLLFMIFWKMWTFLKTRTSTWKMWSFTRHFFLKSGPQPEKCRPLPMIFWKKWSSTWKCGPFTLDFLKKVDLDLKMWTFYTWFSEKSGPWPEHVDLLCMIF